METRLILILLFRTLLKDTKNDSLGIVWFKDDVGILNYPTKNGKWYGINEEYYIKYFLIGRDLWVILETHEGRIINKTYKLGTFSILYWIVKKLNKSVNQFIW